MLFLYAQENLVRFVTCGLEAVGKTNGVECNGYTGFSSVSWDGPKMAPSDAKSPSSPSLATSRHLYCLRRWFVVIYFRFLFHIFFQLQSTK